MTLSERLRPNAEAAPWVVDEIRALEAQCDTLRAENEALAKNLRGKHATTGATYQLLIAERDALREQVAAWVKENGPGGWIHALRAEAEAARRQKPTWFIDERGVPQKYHDSKADYCKCGGLDLLYPAPSLPPAHGVPDKWVQLVKDLVREIERNTCAHEETHRGGHLWEICDACGAKWADDEGGKPEFEWPKAVERAWEMLAAAQEAEGCTHDWSFDCEEHDGSAGYFSCTKCGATHTAPPSPKHAAPDVTNAMALAFHRALTDGCIGASEIEEIKVGLRAALEAAQEAKR